MAYDFSIINEKNEIIASAPIPVDGHEEIIRVAEKVGAKLLLRMSDYYQDACYSNKEMQNLREELTKLQQNLDKKYPNFIALSELVAHLKNLTLWSQESDRRIEVIAD